MESWIKEREREMVNGGGLAIEARGGIVVLGYGRFREGRSCTYRLVVFSLYEGLSSDIVCEWHLRWVVAKVVRPATAWMHPPICCGLHRDER